jgi:hypothetical protein
MSLAAIDLQFTNEKYVFINFVYEFRGGEAHAAVQESRWRFLNCCRPNRAVGVQQEPLQTMKSLAIEGHGIQQGVYDEAEILRRVRRRFTTSDRRISRQMHTRQIQV